VNGVGHGGTDDVAAHLEAVGLGIVDELDLASNAPLLM
jgi:hypothetical protein